MLMTFSIKSRLPSLTSDQPSGASHSQLSTRCALSLHPLHNRPHFVRSGFPQVGVCWRFLLLGSLPSKCSDSSSIPCFLA